ncbi:FecCD family ABC transporter permease [Actinomycetospora termitidis]|uniref:Iron chelate uptake ABC transporter family permease subunit n=1 Tax=Actinomycetospora termitidis TaxID=3053470 RepID=A0ABT7MFT7_9PSEU|nr:iron chelate uptake ABC transporter family permease subunit [Actinomycetospora sp. Odt1-22]MDL5159528.1 iron chelate uptake ABC transporter family permease subunit [Actinomycetospora sp. Odt1-22]
MSAPTDVRVGEYSVRVRPRPVVVVVVLLALAVVLGAVALTLGEFPLPLSGVVDTLLGSGTRAQQFVVLELRAPRVVLALVVGATLGVAGAVFQALARNALASPDLLGFTTGAASGALVAIVAFGAGALGTAGGAVVGVLVTAGIALALLGGETGGYRLVLVGIGLNAILYSLNNYLILRSDLSTASAAQTWLVGSLNGRDWTTVAVVGIGLVVLLVPALAVARRLDLLGMGDEAAGSIGVPVRSTRVVALVVGVLLVGTATAAVGPIAFVALAAPQLARRLAGTTGPTMIASGVLGGVLLLAGDVLGQRLAAPAQFPAGTMTASIGGLYLVWLLAREWKADRG